MRFPVVLATVLLVARTHRHDEDNSSADTEHTERVELKAQSSPLLHDKNPSDNELLKEVLGARRLKSKYDMYVRVSKPEREWTASMSTNQTCTEWNIEEYHGKVLLQPKCAPDNYLRSKQDYTVSLYGHEVSRALWIPFKNKDGSWSFRSVHGTWLSASPDGKVNGIVSLKTHRRIEEQFWLESFTDHPSSDRIPPHLLHDIPSTTVVLPINHDDQNADHDHSVEHRSSEVLNQKQSALSREVAGRRKLKSPYLSYHEYLSAAKFEAYHGAWTVFVSGLKTKYMKWHVEDHNGKVALRLDGVPGNYLSSQARDSAGIAEHRSEHEMWTPLKNENGSWSFQSLNRTWLYRSDFGRISLASDRQSRVHFWLESWTDTDTTTTTSPHPTTTEIIQTIPTTSTTGIFKNDKFDIDTPSSKYPNNEIAQLNPDVSRQSRHASSSYLIVIFIFAALIILLLAIIAEQRRSIIRQRKQDLSLSYRNLVGEDLQP